jgi:hypothetical protein
MAKIETNELLEPITEVLRSAASGTPDGRGFLTSYQILKRLDQTLQDRLQTEYGDAGKKSEKHFGPATRVLRSRRRFETSRSTISTPRACSSTYVEMRETMT